MKLYLIYNKRTKSVLGYTCSKKAVKYFLKQRGRECYHIESYKEEELLQEEIDNFKALDMLEEFQYGKDIYVFDYEVELFEGGFTEYIDEMKHHTIELLKQLEFIKFSKGEHTIIKNFIKEIAPIIHIEDFDDHPKEFDYDLNKIFNILEMINRCT